MTGSLPHDFKYRAEPTSDKEGQKRVEDNQLRKQKEKPERRYSRRRSQRNDHWAFINEEESIDQRTLLQREKRSNEKLKNEFQELKFKQEGKIQQLKEMLDSQSEKFETKKIEFLFKIKQLEKENEELRNNQRHSNSQTQQLLNKVNQLSAQLKANEQLTSKLKRLLEESSESSERKSLTQIQALNALLSQKKQDLNRKDREIDKLNKRLIQQNEQQIQQRSNYSAYIEKLQKKLKYALAFQSMNETQMQGLKQNVQQKEILIAQRDRQISKLNELLKKSQRHQKKLNELLNQSQRHQKKDEDKTEVSDVVEGTVDLQKMVQALNALLSQKKQDLNRKDVEIDKLNKWIEHKKQQQIQQKSNYSAQVAKLKQQLERAQSLCSINEIQIEDLKESILQKERLIAKRGREISKLRQSSKNQSSPLSSSKKQKKYQKKDEDKTAVLNVISGTVDLQKMVIDSEIVKCIKQQKILIGMFAKDRRPKGFKLLFRASDHGFDVKYKEKYCGVAHTVLLVKTEYGKVIGGYTPLKWKILKEIHGYSSLYDFSGESFVFSISNNHKLILESPTEKKAVRHHNEFGPQFYGGIWITNKSNTENKSWSLDDYPLSYVHPEYEGWGKESWTKFDGSSNGHFYTQQWEVHRLIFEEQY